MTEKNDPEQYRKELTPEQFHVAFEGGTEPPFRNAFWNEKRKGLYKCVAGGTPLFHSDDKFDSGTGWPSFTKPVDPDAVITREDTTHGMVRTEVLDAKTGAHLGHVFPDGPNGNLRYCINSAALTFEPEED